MATGDPISWSDVATRVATVSQTSDSATFTTTQTTLITATPSLVSGKTYGIWVYFRMSSSVAADVAICRIREDSTSGTELSQGQFYLATNSSTGYGFSIYGEYTAVSTGTKTLVFTAARNAGSGNLTLKGATVAPSKMLVDLIPA